MLFEKIISCQGLREIILNMVADEQVDMKIKLIDQLACSFMTGVPSF